MRKPIEPILIEPVRGRLDCEMRDALAGQRIERTVQRDRIGRGQRAVSLAARRHDADGADAGGAMAERGPDLAREGGDRRLAAGAGDGGDGVRLARKKFRRHQRQRAPGIADVHESDMRGQWSVGPPLARMTAAPAAIAGPTKLSPSVLPPRWRRTRRRVLTARTIRRTRRRRRARRCRSRWRRRGAESREASWRPGRAARSTMRRPSPYLLSLIEASIR